MQFEHATKLNFVAGFWRGRFAVLAMALLMSLVAKPSRALSVVAPTFSELVQTATEIVRVEVIDVSARFDNASANSPIHTYVRCRILRALKGGADATITLRILGGQVGDEVLEIPDMPVFAVGGKYIFFVAQNGRAFCPLVGVMHGSYPIVTEAAGTGVERVLRNNREPLQSVAGVVLPMADRAGVSAYSATALGSALSVEQFETAILREIANAKRP